MTGPLRVLHVSLHTDPYDEPGAGDVGGMNVVVRSAAEAMAAQGHLVEVVTRRARPEAEALSTPAPGVRVRRLPVGPARRLAKGDHEDLITPFGEQLRTLTPPDVVHSHHWFSGAAALPVARRWVVPHVQSFHSIAAAPGTALAHGERPESPGRLTGEQMLARESDVVVAVSRAEGRTVRERLGGTRVALARPGVDAGLFTPGADGGTYALVAARLEPLKGIDLAIAALGQVPAHLRPPLVVAGGTTAVDSSYRTELEQLAADLDVAARFTGPQSRAELATTLHGARVLLVPSHSETYGLVALEAAASAVPVLAADTGGLREAVVDGVTGTLLATRDPRAWAAAVTKLVEDQALAAQLGKAGREHALRHSWDHTAGQLVAAYREVLD